ncbi:MAG: hypothetical protein NTU79_20395 [Planctomycetota bacterium]|nr:hypothetical protein [Planctomycetota bacterium]
MLLPRFTSFRIRFLQLNCLPLFLLALGFSSPLVGQEKSATAKVDTAKEEKSKTEEKKETIVTTKHSLAINGIDVTYEAVAGKLQLKDDALKSKAEQSTIP